MDSIAQLLSWAESKGIILNGITPKVLPGRGIGIVSTRRIEPNETILTVPTHLLRTLDNTPKSIVAALPDATVHAILAASLALDLAHPPNQDFTIWKAVFPTQADIATSMPICWPPPLQDLLPSAARALLAKQRVKFDRDWAQVSAADHLGPLCREDYLYAWLLVNTRTFYHTTPRTKKDLPRDDHMALQPVADLFNHSPAGCTVSFTPAGFTITATHTSTTTGPDQEVFIRYGPHSDDFLLAEYGFTLPRGLNTFDEVCLDEYLCPRFTPAQRDALESRGFWGGYMLDAETACYRTQVALKVSGLPPDDWADVLEGLRDEDEDIELVDRQLLKILRRYAADIEQVKVRVNDVSVGDVMRNTLRERWQHIGEMVDNAIARISR
ncbi:Ribosomal N-lysine methyltransferase-like protein [Hapsidospora chrysogenum ATCC 11550]|uniref:Ribosomal N-lysine methyltransferase-like protein n=1 Tax=Hapsidospora chrysogenum (strain ATCC 11550 / CBS 779.69 / DSM 880 / IAM 14645 / JCM 23072 / IMI 49137) TaxID=857340 RepID=A0A086TCB6_HAPC1|nr:Ribosomal N-lysine methyltransferase-like protein [Hapsidospora chrysogenum ATCC 11550]